ncbi:MAG: PIN domain-containing protein [Actinomycetota bacterium]|nr:PIN domain-containing protein [Actinomycetota bacterium]
MDTSVWSLALRRKQTYETQTIAELRQFIEDGESIFVLGVIIQELLAGIMDHKLFERVAEHLANFPMITLERRDYIEAAKLRNACKRRGFSAGAIDFLIASTCIQRNLLLYTLDKDFQNIAAVSSLKLLQA